MWTVYKEDPGLLYIPKLLNYLLYHTKNVHFEQRDENHFPARGSFVLLFHRKLKHYSNKIQAIKQKQHNLTRLPEQ